MSEYMDGVGCPCIYSYEVDKTEGYIVVYQNTIVNLTLTQRKVEVFIVLYMYRVFKKMSTTSILKGYYRIIWQISDMKFFSHIIEIQTNIR